jgi:hypothetical protein
VLLFASRRFAVRSRLRDDVTAEQFATGERRIVVYQSLHGLCLLIGMASTYAGIALLVLLQLNSAIAPPNPAPGPVLSPGRRCGRLTLSVRRRGTWEVGPL